MKLGDLGEDRLLNELLPRLSPGKASFSCSRPIVLSKAYIFYEERMRLMLDGRQ